MQLSFLAILGHVSLLKVWVCAANSRFKDKRHEKQRSNHTADARRDLVADRRNHINFSEVWHPLFEFSSVFPV